MTRFLLVEAERPISRSVPGDIVACDEMLEGLAMQRAGCSSTVHLRGTEGALLYEFQTARRDISADASVVMAGLDPAIHVFLAQGEL